MSPSYNLPLNLALPAHLADHQVMGRVVLPAVHAVAALAQAAREWDPGLPVHTTHDASFQRFITIPEGTREMAARAALTLLDTGGAEATLMTEVAARGGAVSRLLEHVKVTFAPARPPVPPPEDETWILHGPALIVPRDKFYAELVPFGPSFQNVLSDAFLAPNGALGRVGSQEPSPPGPLGSPYPLDAVFQLASAWCQRFRGVVTFPAGYRLRYIYRRALATRQYFGRVLPVGQKDEDHLFDVWLHDLKGEVVECVQGLIMSDLSRGRVTPPDWVRADLDCRLPEAAPGQVELLLLEHEALPACASLAFSPRERHRAQKMGPRRLPGFMAVRLGLKLLARKLDPKVRQVPSSRLDTLDRDPTRPRLPPELGQEGYHCSASHDRRFTLVAVADRPVGVDVEEIAERAWRGGRLFLSPAERRLAEASPLGKEAAAVRIWSVKECVAKLMNWELVRAWKEVEVVEVAQDGSRLQAAGQEARACHSSWGGHLFTCLTGLNPPDAPPKVTPPAPPELTPEEPPEAAAAATPDPAPEEPPDEPAEATPEEPPDEPPTPA
ncbi:MAG: polyketide synthase dehydratase domain-containing protein [Deltaproteobacteria bacterium]|nr:polyketide synthase dehydratase domain-containing protein [Deltaproteobacteria bacterium]